MSRILALALASAIAASLTFSSAQANQRVFVASYGSDANTATNCVFANPCRAFAAAMTVVDPGGEIVALDTAGYGMVVVTKSVTITAAPGYFAGISAASGTAVTIATVGVDVILRGLNINGVGGNYGVVMTNGASLTIENCVVAGFTGGGIYVATAAKVRITDTIVRGNVGTVTTDGITISNGATAGISNVKMSGNQRSAITAQDGFAGSTNVTVANSDAYGNGYGFVAYSNFAGGTARILVGNSTSSSNLIGVFAVNGAGTGAIATVGGSVISQNGVGLQNQGFVLETLGNNILRQNSSATSGTITTVAGG